MSEETEVWQKIALVLGWNEWELGVGPEAKKQKEKERKKKQRISNSKTRIKESTRKTF